MPQPNYEMVVVYRSTEKSIQNNTTAPDVDLRTSVQPKHQFTSSDDCQQHDIIRLIPKCEPPKQRITSFCDELQQPIESRFQMYRLSCCYYYYYCHKRGACY